MEAFALFLFYFPLEEDINTFFSFLFGAKWLSQDQNQPCVPAQGENGDFVTWGSHSASPQFPLLLNSPSCELQTGLWIVTGHPSLGSLTVFPRHLKPEMLCVASAAAGSWPVLGAPLPASPPEPPSPSEPLCTSVFPAKSPCLPSRPLPECFVSPGQKPGRVWVGAMQGWE